MDADDEPAMAYFLPNGIADDSPPKRSHIKASFGPIGGRSAANSPVHSTPTPSGNASTSPAASGGQNSRPDKDFSVLQTHPRPALEPSTFGAPGEALSPRPTNFLLSDLGGEIHTPKASRGFGESDGTRSSSPFGFTGSFASGLGEARHGGAIGAGAIRSPSSMFDRGHEPANTFSMQHVRERDRSPTASGPFTDKTNDQQLYSDSALSYLGSGGSNTFGASAIRTWPSREEPTQPRRILQRPPGLAGPPGLEEPSPMDGLQVRMIGSGRASGLMQQHVAGHQFGAFRPSASSPMGASSAGNGAFSSGEDQFGPSLLPQLSGLRLSPGVYDHGVSNPELAELNTQSIKVGETNRMRGLDPSSAPWSSREPTASRRIDVQSRTKTPRSPKKSRDGRKKTEGRSDLRARALEFSMDAVNAFTPGSPMKPKRVDRGRKMASPGTTHDSSPMSIESRGGSDQLAPRGKRRGQAVDKPGTSSSTLSVGGGDPRRKLMTNQTEDQGSTRSTAPGLDIGSPMKPPSRESTKPRRREGGGETKSSSRGVFSKKSSTRGSEKGASTARRQVYREKQVKEIAKESLTQEDITSSIEPHTAASPSSKEDERDSEGRDPNSKCHEQNAITKSSNPSSPVKLDDAVAIAEPFTAVDTTQTEESVPTLNNSSDGDGRIVPDKGISDAIEVNIASETAESSAMTGASSEAQSDILHTPEPKTERESSFSSDGPEGSRTDSPRSERVSLSFESSESDAERAQGPVGQPPAVLAKKSKRKSGAPITTPGVASTERALPISSTEALNACDPPRVAAIEKKQVVKETRKDKAKKEKADKKKATRGKKDKRGSSLISKAADALNDSTSEAQDKLLEALASTSTPLSTRISKGLRDGVTGAASAGLLALLNARRGCVWIAGRLNIKGVFATGFSYVESVLAVVFSVVLLLSLHAASWFIRIHRVAFRAILTHRHIGFCFAFLYGFPFLVQYVFPWAPPWAPVCLWYAFLVQLFCTNGPTAMVTTFRVILPLVFLVEGISHHSFLLDLNGAELLLASFIVSAVKTSNLCSPVFFLSLATQCLLAVFLGAELLVQWLQLALALYSLHIMASTDDEWVGMGDEEEDLSCHPVSMHHSIADYNQHPAPSSAVSIQKTKRLDRRALAYVRGRKLR